MPEKIIIIAGARIGDAICYTPAFHLLRKHKPNAQIDIIAGNINISDVYKNNPDIDNIIISPTKKETKELRAQYDFALSMNNGPDFMQYVNWLNLKTYFAKDHFKIHIRQCALNLILSVLDLDKPDVALGYRVYPQKKNEEKARKILLKNGATLTKDEILIGCHIGCFKVDARSSEGRTKKINSRKTWPFKYYVKTLKLLIKQNPNIKFVLTGSESERKLAAAAFKKLEKNIVLVGGETTFLDLAAMMKFFKVFLSGDCGPMHLAAAMDCNQVAVIPSHKITCFGPLPETPHRIIIDEKKMKKIRPKKVVKAILNLLNPPTPDNDRNVRGLD